MVAASVFHGSTAFKVTPCPLFASVAWTAFASTSLKRTLLAVACDATKTVNGISIVSPARRTSGVASSICRSDRAGIDVAEACTTPPVRISNSSSASDASSASPAASSMRTVTESIRMSALIALGSGCDSCQTNGVTRCPRYTDGGRFESSDNPMPLGGSTTFNTALETTSLGREESGSAICVVKYTWPVSSRRY